jgi:hypothetical protein
VLRRSDIIRTRLRHAGRNVNRGNADELLRGTRMPVTLRTHCVLLSAFMLVCGAPSADEPTPIPAVHLFTYPAGPTPDLVSDIPCSEGGRGCQAGIVALGPDDAIYFYDFYNNNIKVLDASRGSLLQLVEGPADLAFFSGRYHEGVPFDLVVEPSGAVDLLADKLTSGAEYWILRRDAEQRMWKTVLKIPRTRLGVDPNTSGGHYLVCGPDGTVYLHDLSAGISLPVPLLEGLSPDEDYQSILSRGLPGVPLADGNLYPWATSSTRRARGGSLVIRSRRGLPVRELAGITGTTLNVTEGGVILMWGGQGYDAEVSKINAKGSIMTLGGRAPGGTKELLGKGSILGSSSGRIYQFICRDGLEAWALAGER